MLDNLKQYKVILASASPRRYELLSGIGVDFEVRTINGLEETFPSNLVAEEIPLYLSKQKASAYSPLPNELIITADTIVWLEGQQLGKPKDRDDAIDMLRKLSGKVHKVYTGVTLTTSSTQRSFFSETEVEFSVLSDDDIIYYVDNYKPFDKAGAYGVQEWIGYVAVKAMRGSYYNVMGLPVHQLYEELKTFL